MINNFKKARTERSLSLEQAAEAIGVKPEMLCAWETGEEEPFAHELRQMAEVYRCSPDYLLGLVSAG